MGSYNPKCRLPFFFFLFVSSMRETRRHSKIEREHLQRILMPVFPSSSQLWISACLCPVYLRRSLDMTLEPSHVGQPCRVSRFIDAPPFRPPELRFNPNSPKAGQGVTGQHMCAQMYIGMEDMWGVSLLLVQILNTFAFCIPAPRFCMEGATFYSI